MVLLRTESIEVTFNTEAGKIRAVDGVGFNVERSEIIGLAGESGSGKSTLGYALLRLLPGNAVVRGRIIFDDTDLTTLDERQMRGIRGRRISMIFQGSMNCLNPVIRVENQIAEPLIIHEDLASDEAVLHARKLLSQVGVDPEKGRSYPHELSGGLKQRVVIAMALSTKPDLLIADEPTTALDVMTQAQIMQLISKLRDENRIGIILITHDLALLSEVADKIAIMYAGKFAEIGRTQDVVKSPAHPYTKSLLASIPSVDRIGVPSSSIPGDPPDPINLPAGCPFRARCSFAKKECGEFENKMRRVKDKHDAACILVEGIST